MRSFLIAGTVVVALIVPANAASPDGRAQLERQAQIVLNDFGLDADVSDLSRFQLGQIHLTGRDSRRRGNQLGMLRAIIRNDGGILCFPRSRCLIEP